jgi:hypothetical protein
MRRGDTKRRPTSRRDLYRRPQQPGLLKRIAWRMGKENMYAAGLLSLAIVVTLAMLRMGQAESELPRTAEGCLESEVLPAIEVVVIDATERLEAHEAERLAAEIRRRAAAMPAEGKFAIAVLMPNGDGNAHLVFSRCKPDDGAAATGWSDNPRMIREYFSETFGNPLDKILSALPGLGGAKSSPILETFYAVSSLFEGAAHSKRLLIVSDLLEYSPLFSMYKPFSWQRALRIPKVSAMKDLWQGVEASVLLRTHNRTRALHSAHHAAFWKTYFNYAGVAAVRFMPL